MYYLLQQWKETSISRGSFIVEKKPPFNYPPPRTLVWPSVRLSALRFRSRYWKPMGGFLSYCTQPSLMGVELPFGAMTIDLREWKTIGHN